MPSSIPKCPKCHSAMEEGFILDQGHHNTASVSKWVEGPPEKRWWGLNTKGREKILVTTFRCTRCGYLESYAIPAQE